MPPITSVDQVDLSPKPGKTYFETIREWREEFIYFLMVDRFHDSANRAPALHTSRSKGIATPDGFFGGTLRGVKDHLDYIAGLGCTAIWLSPIFETRAYHGYDISSYLDIDPHFGTKDDLIQLVDAAHGRNPPMRIILDVVINHSGDNWSYQGGGKEFNGQRFEFGDWRRPDRPIPTELRDPDWYHRRGDIQHFDASPENQLGDISGLKDFANDDDAIGSEVINTLIKAHCFWIREADVDGFRVDAVKHMSDVACSRFASNIREYAYSLGKRGFFLFGEVATPSDDLYNRYLGQNTSQQDANDTVFFGLDSVLDFRLAEGVFGDDGNVALAKVLKGEKGPQTLFNRLDAQRQRALNRGELGRYLVTFVDNHDSFWQPTGRFGKGADEDQIIGAIGYLLCSLGACCIYYGTEQGFEGSGGDVQMREGMFDPATPGENLLNGHCRIYKEIRKIANVMRTNEPLRFGRMYFREISRNSGGFGRPFGTEYTLAFSRIVNPSEILVAYNVSPNHHQDSIIVDATLHRPGEKMTFLYGGSGTVTVKQAAGGGCCVELPLDGHKFAILK
jgi:glycosidase